MRLDEPALLVGQVMHKRLRPRVHAFVYPVFTVCLPLSRLAEKNSLIFGVDRSRPLAFVTRDHGARDGSPLLPWIRARLAERGLPADGEVVLQCFPRVFGYVFNPVSFWYCHDAAGRLVAVLAEVNNTFGDTHAYLLHRPDRGPLVDGESFRADKVFHVSPFCDVEGGYRFRFHLDRPVPLVRIAYDDAEGELLLTALSGRPQGWGDAVLARVLLRMPFLTLGVIARIHWQALRLWLKGVPFVGARPTVAASPTFTESVK